MRSAAYIGHKLGTDVVATCPRGEGMKKNENNFCGVEHHSAFCHHCFPHVMTLMTAARH
jgi:hypothetical protein